MYALKTYIKKAVCITVAALMGTALMAAGCDNPDDQKTSGYTVTFDYNYDGAPAAVEQNVEEGEPAVPPADVPERDRYSFAGWHTDEACTQDANFEYVITQDTTYYAGWDLTRALVTFYLNDGTDGVWKTEEVDVRTAVAEPGEVPESEGSLFEAWYADEACTQLFDFSASITKDTAVYAGWTEDDGNSHTVTYMWNYDGAPDGGVYRSQTVADRVYLTLPSPERGSDYKFIYWYTDPECTQAYDNTSKVRDDVTLYALWYNNVTFEAEYTYVSDIFGYGYSGNLKGEKIINKDIDNKANASNGWYVSYLYYKGITLTFNIYAEEDIEDAYLYLRLSAEYYDLSITDEQFLVKVNGEEMKYGTINIPINNAGSSGGVTSSSVEVEFKDFLVGQNISLKKGENVIELVVNNWKPEDERTGTMYSYAPVVDAIKICSAGDISAVRWADGYPLVDNLDKANNTYG